MKKTFRIHRNAHTSIKYMLYIFPSRTIGNIPATTGAMCAYTYAKVLNPHSTLPSSMSVICEQLFLPPAARFLFTSAYSNINPLYNTHLFRDIDE